MEKWDLIVFKIKIIYCLAGAPAYSGHRCDCWPRHSSYQLQVTCWRLKKSNKQTWLLLFFLKNLKGSLLGYFQGWEAADAPTRWVFGGPAWPNLCCLQHVNTVIVWKRFYVCCLQHANTSGSYTHNSWIHHVESCEHNYLKNTKKTLNACFCTPVQWLQA